MNHSNEQPLSFIVYFEIFGIKKKYTVCNELVTNQSQAELYVKTIVIHKHLVFYDANKVKKTNDNDGYRESFTKLWNDLFGKFSNENSFFKKNKNEK